MGPVVVKFEDRYGGGAPPKASKEDARMLKSGKPLTLAEMRKHKAAAAAAAASASSSSSKDAQQETENDLQLKRLLDESHILQNVGRDRLSGAQLTLDTVDMPMGKARVRTLDHRIRTLSETNGDPRALNKLEKIPMKRRQRLIAREREKQAQYEADAKDAGIVLSRRAKGQLRYTEDANSIAKERLFGRGNIGPKKHTSKGLKIHSAGKTVEGGLFFSKAEIDRVNGVDRRGGGGRGGRGGRGGSRGGRGGRGSRGGRN